MIRDKIWSNFIRTKYQAIYLSHFNSHVRTFDRLVNILLTLASSTSIGGWLIWKQFPYLWASILGISQLVNVIKPFLPYLKDKERLSETYIFYETLHLDYEKLWTEFERDENEEQANDKYFELKNKELTIIDKIKDVKVNNFKKIERLTRTEWADYLQTNYNIKIDE